MTDEEQFAHFEKIGIARVRDTAPHWQPHLQALAYRWLKMQEDGAKAEADNAMRDAADRTERQEKHQRLQNLITQGLAGAALVISILSWLFPRH
jgi:hypothetical protein